MSGGFWDPRRGGLLRPGSMIGLFLIGYGGARSVDALFGALAAGDAAGGDDRQGAGPQQQGQVA